MPPYHLTEKGAIMTMTATARAGDVGRLGHRRDDHMEEDPQAWAASMLRYDINPQRCVPHQMGHCPLNASSHGGEGIASGTTAEIQWTTKLLPQDPKQQERRRGDEV